MNQKKVELGKGIKKILFAFIPSFLLIFLLGLGYLVHQSNYLYHYLKTNQKGFDGNLFSYDPELGYSPVLGARGYEIVTRAAPVPVRFDDHGFRVPVDEVSSFGSGPLLLALGCSHTYGAGIKAEDSYPFLVAKRLKGTALNAGMPGYGLAQMLVLARRLIPQYKPDYVLVQFSSWLIDRGQSAFAPTFIGIMPSPFFIDAPAQGLALHPPVFHTRFLDLPISLYRHTPNGITDYLSFLIKVGLPLFITDDFHLASYYTKLKLGLIPKPTKERERMVRVVFNEIERLSKENHSQLVIVILHDPFSPEPSLAELLRIYRLEEALVVDPGPALIERLREKSALSYYRAYGRVMGLPPVVINSHPNELAHQIIAEEVLRVVQERKF